MKINLEKLDLLVDLMMQPIVRECSGNVKLLQGSKVNEEVVEEEIENVEEELEDVDEQITSKGMLLAKAAAEKAAKLRQAANAGANMAARGGNAGARTAAVLRT